MDFNKINTPEELYSYMEENINYGFVADNKCYLWDDEEFAKLLPVKWHLSTPQCLIEFKYGQCFDQVELERSWFLDHGYSFKTFFVWFELPYNNPYATHTYLVYEDRGKYYYFEHADFANRGIKAFDSYEAAIKNQMECQIAFNAQGGTLPEDVLNSLTVYEYQSPPYGVTFNEFIDYILDYGEKIIF